jgi:ankyrin repeat protein
MKYIRLYEERLKDFEIMVGDTKSLIEELRDEIEKEDYDLDYIRDLVFYGHFDIDVIWKDILNRKWTFLQKASQLNKADIARVLLEEGADPNIQDEFGITALMRASGKGHTQVVQELLKHPQTNPNLQDSGGSTALMNASMYGLSQVVQALLSHPKTNLNLQNEWGENALYWASKEGHSQVVQELLKYPNIDPNLQNKYGDTALMRASIGGHSKVVKLLLSHPNIDPNLQGSYGFTALHWASLRGHSQVVQALLSYPNINIMLTSTNTTIINKKGETAWDLAKPEIREEFPELNPDVK